MCVRSWTIQGSQNDIHDRRASIKSQPDRRFTLKLENDPISTKLSNDHRLRPRNQNEAQTKLAHDQPSKLGFDATSRQDLRPKAVSGPAVRTLTIKSHHSLRPSNGPTTSLGSITASKPPSLYSNFRSVAGSVRSVRLETKVG